MNMHDLKPISHFDLNQQVCMDWIDPDNHFPKKKRTYQARYSSVQSATCSTSSSSEFMQRETRFNDKSLHPITGSLNDLEAISHFYFNQQVCMAWIDPDNHWPKKKHTYQARDSSVASATRSTLSSSEFMQRAPRFTGKSLHPITGSLYRRLE